MKHTVKNSNIKNSGNGIFAKTPFTAGAFIHVDFTNNNLPPVGIFEHDFTQSQETRMMNHSTTPNSECRFINKNQLARFALRDIKAGEEITADYNQIIKQVNAQGHHFYENVLWFEESPSTCKKITNYVDGYKLL